MKLPTLYSRTSLGQTQEWTIEIDGPSYRTHEGIVGGQITTSSWTKCQGKNKGRANETSPEEQSEREARAKHKKKIEKGYFEDISKIDEETFFEPMLAHKWKDYGDEVKWPAMSQPKLDGSRFITRSSGGFSRTGKPVVSAPHILEVLEGLFKKYPNLVLDGELYNHDLKYDFNRLMSLARQTKPTTADLEASRKELEYWVYDCDLRGNETFEERYFFLKSLKGLPLCVRIVQTLVVHNQQELDKLYEQYLEEGYEGQMIRVPDSLYDHKRSKSLLKRKEFVDQEFQLVDLEEGRGNRAGMAARAVLKTEAGVLFEAGMIGSHEYCVELLKNKAKYIGKMATVQFQNMTPDGKPRFGKLKEIREE